jgi:multiple sugar transport system ATP-binding protein
LAGITLKDVSKIYPGSTGEKAVDGFCLDIKDKEFVVIVGPSGCGKSSTMRMIAGLEEVSEGEIHIGDVLVNDVQPKDRNIAMVFQSYALYPHMSVYKNMAFALKIRHLNKAEIDRRVRETAEMLGITRLLARKPRALSGGESQRVALGRAMVRNPAVFLLDEPLSNLDAKLRADMRAEIIRLHKRLETTFIYVTHDQTEAMTMGDRIVIMDRGLILQNDSPKDIYDYPANIFVAGFIGSPRMNFVEAEVAREGGIVVAKFGVTALSLEKTNVNKDVLASLVGKKVTIGIRPEHISVADSVAVGEGLLGASADIVEVLGAETIIHTDMPGDLRIVVREFNDVPVKRGQKLNLAVQLEKIHIFDIETEDSITVRPGGTPKSARSKIAKPEPDSGGEPDASDNGGGES